jgi:hypothetical protein
MKRNQSEMSNRDRINSLPVVPAAPGFSELRVWLEPRNVEATVEVIEERLHVEPVVAWRIECGHLSALTPWLDYPDELALQSDWMGKEDIPGIKHIVSGLELPDGRVNIDGFKNWDIGRMLPNREAFVQYALNRLRERQIAMRTITEEEPVAA